MFKELIRSYNASWARRPLPLVKRADLAAIANAERVEGLSNEIEAIARQDAGCERLMSVPGIGPMISSAMVAAIGAGDVFTSWWHPFIFTDIDADYGNRSLCCCRHGVLLV